MEQNARAASYDAAASIRAEAKRLGFDLSLPLTTKDGDRVRVIGIDTAGTAYAIVAEIIEDCEGFLFKTKERLARFSTRGVIEAKTYEARHKHSLKPNTKVGSAPRWPLPDSVPAKEPVATRLGTIDHILCGEAVSTWAMIGDALNRGDVPGLGKNYEQALRDKAPEFVAHSVIPREVKADIVKEFKSGQDLVLVIRGDTPDKWCVTGWK